MARLNFIKISFFAVFLLASYVANGQNFYKEKIPRKTVFSVGLGPSLAYMDNGGQYMDGNFKIKPSIATSFSKYLNRRIDLRATFGFQQISSGGNPSADLQYYWQSKSASFTTKGSVFYLDVMPSISLFPTPLYFNRNRFNVNIGAGVGVMQSFTEETKSFDVNEIPLKRVMSTVYVPIRGSISFKLTPYSDLALELSVLWTLTDELDGNSNTNRYNDQLTQTHLVYRRYLMPKSN
jgi:hypothetical protein